MRKKDTAVKATGRSIAKSIDDDPRDTGKLLRRQNYANKEFVMLPRTTRMVPAYRAGTCAKECGEGDSRVKQQPPDTDRIVTMLRITRRKLAVAGCRISRTHRAFVLRQPTDVMPSVDP
jgi:hypothetical protein